MHHASVVHHQILGPWQQIPCLPECQHLFWTAQRNPDVCIHGWELPADQNVVLAEVLDDVLGRMERVHHYKIGMRVNGFEPPCHGLIEKLLSVGPTRRDAGILADMGFVAMVQESDDAPLRRGACENYHFSLFAPVHSGPKSTGIIADPRQS